MSAGRAPLQYYPAMPDNKLIGDCQVTSYTTRPATLADAPTIARIYSEGIADRIATFETETRTPAQILEWLRPGTLILVAEVEKHVVAFAASFSIQHETVLRGHW